MSDQSPEATGEIFDSLKHVRQSPSLGKLAAALAKAQGEMQNAEKDGKGNYGKYANLASTWDAIRIPLSKNEIAVYQRPMVIQGKPYLCTMLIHSSGEFVDDGEIELIFDREGGRLTPMQAMGSAVTYARRYGLQSATGVAPADDDGEGAGKPQPAPKAKSPPAPANHQPPVQPTNNFAPAPASWMEKLHGLCSMRQISEGVLNKLIAEGYGEKHGSVKKWVVSEIGLLLDDENTTEATLMALTQRKISERESKRISEGLNL